MYNLGFLSTVISGIGSFLSEAASKIGQVLYGFAKDAINVISKIPIEGVKLEHAC